MNLFDSGARDMFFAKLNKNIPSDVRANNDSFKKLEFYLQVYFFAVKKQSQYNDHTATELLPFFALPYMPKPV
jgi:hypothetical protein